jgi:hypothetical protein
VRSQKACSRAKPDPNRLIAGTAIPWVMAAPRAIFARKLSVIFGVTRMNNT